MAGIDIVANLARPVYELAQALRVDEDVRLGDDNAALEHLHQSEKMLQELLEKGYSVSAARSEGALSATGAGALLVMGHFDGAPPEVQSEVPVQVENLDQGTGPEAVLALVETAREQVQAPTPGG